MRKPAILLFVSALYLFLVALLRWGVRPDWNTAIFLAGGALGIYFLDAAEHFFRLHPSPFRSVVFAALFVIVSLFVVTSSGSFLASGLVLSLYLSMVLWQAGEWRLAKNLDSWFRLLAQPVDRSAHRVFMIAFQLFFVVETLLFVL
jgi:hypothetical protein